MRHLSRVFVLVAALAAAMSVSAVALAGPGKATCSGIVGVVHGHHVVADYVTGVGHDTMSWPPAGQVDASGGAVIPGGPGPGFHFPNGFAPGASFCLPQSQSPGFHIGG
jgi:hypothetical protein